VGKHHHGRAHKNLSMKDATALAQELGFHVRSIEGTGELLFQHDRIGPQRLRVNLRRKDSPQALIVWLRRVEKQ